MRANTIEIIFHNLKEHIEGIGTAEGVDWRAGPVKGAVMGFKNFLIKQPLNHD